MGYRVKNAKLIFGIHNIKIKIQKILGIKSKYKPMSLEQINRIEDSNDRVVELSDYLYNKSEYGINMNNLNEIEQDILATMTFYMETSVGGYNGFIYHGGNLYHEAIQSLEKMGFTEEGNALKDLLKYFPNKTVPKELTKRDNFLTEELEEACVPYNKVFEPNKIIEGIIQYYLANKDKIEPFV